MDIKTKQKIRQTFQETKIKRKTQHCKVFQLKIDMSRLNKQELEQLKMFFVEAKWIYNYVLRSEDPFLYNTKNLKIQVMNKDEVLEEKELKFLPARMRMTIVQILQQNIKSLANLKTKNKKTGKLKFKSQINSIDLSLYGQSHKVVKNRLKILGLKRHLVVRGLKQIKNTFELANAKLIQKSSGYYVYITCFEYIKPEQIVKTGKEIGLDFGIKNNITTSEGATFNLSIPETERLKRLQRKLSRQQKSSKNRYKTRLKIQKEYEKISNKKQDVANKFCNAILTRNDVVYMQDENLKGWHKTFGKQIQHSCMGRIKSQLLRSSKTRMIDRWYPSTKRCYKCGTDNVLSLNERVYKCSSCGLVEDRDVKAAKTIMYVGQCQSSYIPVVSRESKLVEKLTSNSKNILFSASS